MILWLMVTAQMIAWAWFSLKAGKLSDKAFLVFTVGMLLGQLGAGIETYMLEAWRAFVIQGFFFLFTVYGGYKRFKQMKLMINKSNNK